MNGCAARGATETILGIAMDIQQQTLDTKDLGAEDVLRSMSLHGEYAVINLVDIDMGESRRNRGRIDQSSDYTIQEYAEAMLRGDRFPAICVRKIPNRKARPYVIAGGWTRTQAKMRAGVDHALAIVVTCDDAEFDLLCKRLNTVNGVRTTATERVMQAAELVLHRGIAFRTAASMMCVDVTCVRAEVCRMRVMQQAAAAGMTVKDDAISQVDAKMISKFSDQPPIAEALTMYVLTRGPAGITSKQIAEELQSVKSESEKLAIIEKAQAASNYGGRLASDKTATRINRRALYNAIGRLEALVRKCKTMDAMQIEKSEHDELTQRLAKLCDAFQILAGG